MALEIYSHSRIHPVLCALCFLLADVALLQADDARIWSDASGKFKIQAKFVANDNGKITLEKTDGSEMEIELKKLSPADQKFIADLEKADSDGPFKTKSSDPFKTKSGNGGKSTSNKSEETRKTGMRGKPFQIGHSGKGATIVIAPNGKFVAADRIVYDFESGKELWNVPSALSGEDKKVVSALSPDGGAFAEGPESGQKFMLYLKEAKGEFNTFEMAVPKNASKLTFVRFSGDQLIAAFRAGASTQVGVYSPDKPKKSVKTFPTDEFSMRTGAISEDGKFLAVGSFQSLKVYDLAKGTPVAAMEAPKADPKAFIGCTGVAFSPDNSELVAVLGTGLYIWSNRGKLLVECPGIVTTDPFYHYNGLLYLPDKSGIMVNGRELFDRTSKMMVWQLKPAESYNHPWSLLDSERVVVSRGTPTNGHVVVINIPRDDLAKATKAIADKVEAVLAPGVPISIYYEVSETRFSSSQDVVNQLHLALTTRLSQLGIPVKENQPVTLKVTYNEVPGETVEYAEHKGNGPPIPKPFRSPFDPPGVKVVSTKHTFGITLTRKDDTKVWWKENFVQGTPGTLQGDTTESNVRNTSFEAVKRRIGEFDVPRFLPVDSSIPTIPIKSSRGEL